MSWVKEEFQIVFECDTCETEFIEVNITEARLGSSRRPPFPDLLPCWDVAKGAGWTSYKRIGHDWTYHCPKCAETAAAAHEEYNKAERERERIKERNARYAE